MVSKREYRNGLKKYNLCKVDSWSLGFMNRYHCHQLHILLRSSGGTINAEVQNGTYQ